MKGKKALINVRLTYQFTKNRSLRSFLQIKKIILALLLQAILLITFIPTNTAAATSYGTVSIIDSYYTDTDNDGYMDDIVSILEFDLQGSFYYHIVYYITLIRPSGTSDTYQVEIRAYTNYFILSNIFDDHATESGNYTIYVDVYMLYPSYAMATVSHVFDPPGGSNFGLPDFYVEPGVY